MFYVPRCSLGLYSSLSVGRYVTVLSPAKTAEPIEISFGVWTQVGPKKPRITWGSGSPMRKGNFDREKRYLQFKWLAEREISTVPLQTESELWRNAGPSAFQLQELIDQSHEYSIHHFMSN